METLQELAEAYAEQENLRGVFRTLYGIKCKNFAGEDCLKGGRCDGNCPRMKNYDKTH